MARGQFRVFDKAVENLGKKGFNLSVSDDYKVMLITTLPTKEDTFLGLAPDHTDYTEVSPLGSVYVTGGLVLAVTWNELTGVTTFDSTVNPGWSQDLAGPDNIIAGLVYSVSETGPDAIGFWDLTTDSGVTPISLQLGDITLTLPAAGMFNISRP